MQADIQLNSIYDFHQFAQLPEPEHPLVSLIDYSKVVYPLEYTDIKWVQNFYSIGLKRNVSKKFNYGQYSYDFQEGILALVAPKQVIRIEIDPTAEAQPSGWLLLIHPDFLWGSPLAQKLRSYDFFGYNVNEALFLSKKEELMLIEIFKNIQKEYQSNIDKFTQTIILTQIELLCNYTERFYERQFITRKIANNELLARLDNFIESHLENGDMIDHGILSVSAIAQQLHISPNYLTSLLRVLLGKATQTYVQEKIVDKAKEKLSTTTMSVSEVAYELGFQHPASFNKLFKKHTALTPSEFKKMFN